MEPRFTFDGIAPLYDAVRAGYPDAVFDRLAAQVPPGASLLEIGCGTGKATVGFARVGFDILAVDPGASMIAQAKDHLSGYDRVCFEQSTFEDWSGDRRTFDLIAAAQAWHWAPPEAGLLKVVRLLRPNGLFAIFGNDWAPLDPAFREAVDAVYLHLEPTLRNSPLGNWYRPGGPAAEMIDGSGLFRDYRCETFGWKRSLSLRDYLAMLRTLSNHQALGPERLDRLIGAVSEAVRGFGAIELAYSTFLHRCRPL